MDKYSGWKFLPKVTDYTTEVDAANVSIGRYVKEDCDRCQPMVKRSVQNKAVVTTYHTWKHSACFSK